MESIAQRNILILGLGDSGLAASELALFHGATVTALDGDTSDGLLERASRLTNRGVHVMLDYCTTSWQQRVDLAVISPGISPESELGLLAAALPCPVISELEFAFRFCSCPILAVTGTNGKTTTVELTVHCLKGAGLKVMAAGNIGTPLSEAARKSAGLDFIVAEVSSFQLERIEQFTPIAAALLNISSDHLDRYPDEAAYLATKLRLFANMTSNERIILNRKLLDREEIRKALPTGGHGPITFDVNGDGGGANYFLAEDGMICQKIGDQVEPVVARSDLKLTGDHNVENVCAALALCHLAGVDMKTSARLVKRFAPNAHRLELVTVHGGVKYINDSKATNPDALIQALRTCQANGPRRNGKIVLIAGGKDKRMDFSPVKPYLAQWVRAVVLIGETKEQLATLWGDDVPCMKFTSMAACVDAAIDLAQTGDTVLLSPGCASQDMFTNYADRGNTFSQEVKRRLGE